MGYAENDIGLTADARNVLGTNHTTCREWPVMDADVIIVGAGPTGLTLAGELRLLRYRDELRTCVRVRRC
jgi:ribulose 1,5-bisphosphate synthetase/thiazole synthase